MKPQTSELLLHLLARIDDHPINAKVYTLLAQVRSDAQLRLLSEIVMYEYFLAFTEETQNVANILVYLLDNSGASMGDLFDPDIKMDRTVEGMTLNEDYAHYHTDDVAELIISDIRMVIKFANAFEEEQTA